jgi:diacylglycerol kinase (ATP)
MLQLMVNPTAGGGRAARAAVQLEGRLLELGRSCELRISAAPGDLTIWTRDLSPSCEAVIAVGGDGTVSEVISGLHANPQPRAFCAVPSGSGNDFAKALGWCSIEDTVRAIVQDKRERIDLVRVGSRIAAYGLGMGFDAEVAQDALSAPAWLRGLPRYLYSILRILPGLETPHLKLIADGVTVYEGKSVLAAAMNTPTAGGGFKLAPNADPRDGFLDIMLGGDLTRLETLLILPRVIAGTHITHRKVRVFRAKHARLEWERPIHAHTDGEQLPLTDCFEVECLASALEVVRAAASH